MTEAVDKIAILLNVNRDNRFFGKRKNKPGTEKRKNDTVTISTEARRLFACVEDERVATDDSGEK